MMTIDDFKAALDRNADRNDNALALTVIGRSTKGWPVRPRVLEHRADGTKVYGLTKAQVRRVIEYEEADHAV